jgi:hypothetical protein
MENIIETWLKNSQLNKELDDLCKRWNDRKLDENLDSFGTGLPKPDSNSSDPKNTEIIGLRKMIQSLKAKGYQVTYYPDQHIAIYINLEKSDTQNILEFPK